jgi:hypothetical protein
MPFTVYVAAKQKERICQNKFPDMYKRFATKMTGSK